MNRGTVKSFVVPRLFLAYDDASMDIPNSSAPYYNSSLFCVFLPVSCMLFVCLGAFLASFGMLFLCVCLCALAYNDVLYVCLCALAYNNV